MTTQAIAAHTQSVLAEVGAERQKQDEKWGEQNHPLLGSVPENRDKLRQIYEIQAENYKALNGDLVEADILGMDTILLEEVFEAFAEADPDLVREEMVQVAAVAVMIIESIDRNYSKEN